jgi:hypothetical protein|tara:strand:+ start:1218 stop:1946 length:729 start_codon:yes stop_codon:yes gene_type:complete
VDNLLSDSDISQTTNDLLLMVKRLNKSKSKLTYKAGCEMLILQELLKKSNKTKIGRSNLFPKLLRDKSISFQFNQENLTIFQNGKEYIGIKPTKLEQTWLSGSKEKSEDWKEILKDLIQSLFKTERLNENDLYYITHVVFFISDFGKRNLELNKELLVCKNILLKFLNGKSENLDLRLECILAITILNRKPFITNDFNRAIKFYRKNGFVKPNINDNDEATIYGVFHTTAVFTILSVIINKF